MPRDPVWNTARVECLQLRLPRRSLWALLTVGAAIGCSTPEQGAQSMTPVSSAPAVRSELAPSGPARLHFIGRVMTRGDTAASYAWSGSGFRARFRGTGFSVQLKDHDNIHALKVDGRWLSPVVTTAEQVRYTLVSGLPLAEHVLELTRSTEALFGVTELEGVTVEGGQLLPPPAPKRQRLEIVGDSISAGYGNEGRDTSCHFSPATENHAVAYGPLLAQELDAELSTVAWSGRGVVKNYGGEAGALMPALYSLTLPELESSRWSFAEGADAVVVNLGTNDFSTEPDPEPVFFRNAYVALLEQVRANNPKAFILCTVGPMLAGQDLARAAAAIGAAVDVRAQRGDGRVQYFSLQTPNQAPGCDWHPSRATHARMAKELAVELRQRLGD